MVLLSHLPIASIAGLFPQAHRLNDLPSDGEADSGPLEPAAARELFPADSHHPGALEKRPCNAARSHDREPAHVYVMRHGERQDMVDTAWAATALRCWDPPLSQFGMQQAAQRGKTFAAKLPRVDVVVSSPFTRCIQTSCGFMRAFGLSADRLIVDARVCEWMSSRNLNLQHVSANRQGQMTADASGWFWGGSAKQGIKEAVTAAWSAAAAVQVCAALDDQHPGHEIAVQQLLCAVPGNAVAMAMMLMNGSAGASGIHEVPGDQRDSVRSSPSLPESHHFDIFGAEDWCHDCHSWGCGGCDRGVFGTQQRRVPSGHDGVCHIASFIGALADRGSC
jgi:broad specificity phosphatase PhoE